VNYISDILKMS